MNLFKPNAFDALPDPILRPGYNRAELTAGILHIGVGNFHRGHQAWYLHRLMQQGEALDWAIVGAGVRPGDEAMRQRLKDQDYLTTLIELDPASSQAEVIGSMIDFVPVQTDNAALIERMAQSDIRIVSLTVTEGGYFIDSATGRFDAEHPEIQHDITNPETPVTAFGSMIQALRKRKTDGVDGFTCMSCDNLQGNGDILKQTILGLARAQDPELAEWIQSRCSFPNSMVDCIVPATTERELALAESMGISDAAPVTHENFRQWVIEDDFCQGRPAWENVGATFTQDVHSYESMKIRILNGGHQVIAVVGELLSVETISGCMEHPLIGKLFEKVARTEIVPHVHAVPGMTANAYVDLISNRFANPKIVDTTRRVAFDGSSRHPGFILPTLREGLAKDESIEGLALVEALWARMCTGRREDGSLIEPNDPNWSTLNEVASRAKTRPSAWLEQTQIYGDLRQAESFVSAFEAWMTRIETSGVEAALEQYLDG
ncbi:MAG: mannitol dehydrogenase family protein [Pseudomonadales bacterium]|jgi:mannitol 2-dehydrogenase